MKKFFILSFFLFSFFFGIKQAKADFYTELPTIATSTDTQVFVDISTIPNLNTNGVLLYGLGAGAFTGTTTLYWSNSYFFGDPHWCHSGSVESEYCGFLYNWNGPPVLVNGLNYFAFKDFYNHYYYFQFYWNSTLNTYSQAEFGQSHIWFISPVGYIGLSPKTPYFISSYSISTSTAWNAIRIQLNQWLYSTSTTPLATNYFDTYLDYGNYQSGTSSVPFLSVFGELKSGYYNYDAEFLSKNHSTGEVISEGGYTLIPHWFWIGLSEGNPYAYPLATASTTPMELCAGIDNSNLVGAFQWAICNVAQWLFVPTDISVDNFQNLGTTFQQKAPFAYFYTIRNSFSSLSSTASPAFSLSTSTGAFNTSIFQPLKTGLNWLLWLMFGIFCVKRIAKFDF